MKAREPRSLGYYASGHWFQVGVVFVLIGLLAIGLLWALNDAKERAEKMIVDLTVRNMRTGMQLAMGEALIQRREGEIATWVGRNPIFWLGSPPDGYLGACSVSGRHFLPEGKWCFDDERRELVYRPHSAERQLARPAGKERQCTELSWRVARAPESATSGSFVGLRIEPASFCQWVVERS